VTTRPCPVKQGGWELTNKETIHEKPIETTFQKNLIYSKKIFLYIVSKSCMYLGLQLWCKLLYVGVRTPTDTQLSLGPKLQLELTSSFNDIPEFLGWLLFLNIFLCFCMEF
jgi:hypothetical protein